jgi:hypothetical protein
MGLSLVIFENPTADEAYPLLATHDPAIIATVRHLILQRLGGQQPGKVLPLQTVSPSQGRDHADT